MAHDTHDTQTSGAMNYAQHEATWNAFIKVGKWVIGILAVTMVLLYFVIQP